MRNGTYSATTKTFHWLTAILILATVPLGLVANDAPFSTDAEITRKTLLFSIHKTLGVAVFIVAVARIAYGVTQTKPAPLHPDRKAETFLAQIVHWSLYISLVLVPLTGWISHSAASVAAPLWLPFAGLLPFVPTDPTVADFFGGLHWLWGRIMIASILLHIAGALKHHIIDKDVTLRRMTFGLRDTDSLPTAIKHSASAPVIAIVLFAVIAVSGAFAGMLKSVDVGENIPTLREASGEWTVITGAIGITITQLSNRVEGNFTDWVTTVAYDENDAGSDGRVSTTINIASLVLGVVGPQALGPDFFDETRFPTAQFDAEFITDGDSWRADGTLTIKGITVAVSLPFDLVVAGNVAQMSGALTLDRRDFLIGESVAEPSNLGFGVDVTINVTARR
tara:strand:+ start:2064 stop:3245 length:1182 start_codon:yes stop_codon:yes gene_type:complete